MIVVVGEALVDLVVDGIGRVSTALGGAPFNTARACGRLGVDVAYAGAVSTDRLGSMLVTRLGADEVSLELVQRCESPTTLALAELDERGAADYRFYVDGTSVPSFTGSLAAVTPDWLFTGGLALVFEPIASTVAAIVAAAPAECAVMIDVNVRPAVVRDREHYGRRLRELIACAHVVKVSDEDLGHLYPDVAPLEAAMRVLEMGPRAVLLTEAAAAVRVVTSDGFAEVPVTPVDVVDTIGAGDSFSGGFLAWWVATGRGVGELGSIDDLVRGVAAGITVAGVTCTRLGADPPWRAELAVDWAT